VDPRPEPAPASLAPHAPVASEPRQRWRLTLARGPEAPRLAGRDLNEAWEAAFEAAGLPLARGGGARPKSPVAFAAPLPVGMEAEAELMDVTLSERWPAWRAREAVLAAMLEGWSLADLADVWLGAPALAAEICAADYRIVVGGGADGAALAGAADGVLASQRLFRTRDKGGSSVRYDLRPLLASIDAVDGAGPRVVLRVRTRFDPQLGNGRPEEVVAALADELGRDVVIDEIVRERLVLADDR
jgi:radical SAM-linked protein